MDMSELRDRLGGAVLEPDDGGYEDARSIFNSMIAKRPAAIAQCESPDDVAAALRFARDAGLEVSRSAAAVTASPAPASPRAGWRSTCGG